MAHASHGLGRRPPAPEGQFPRVLVDKPPGQLVRVAFPLVRRMLQRWAPSAHSVRTSMDSAPSAGR